MSHGVWGLACASFHQQKVERVPPHDKRLRMIDPECLTIDHLQTGTKATPSKVRILSTIHSLIDYTKFECFEMSQNGSALMLSNRFERLEVSHIEDILTIAPRVLAE